MSYARSPIRFRSGHFSLASNPMRCPGTRRSHAMFSCSINCSMDLVGVVSCAGSNERMPIRGAATATMRYMGGPFLSAVFSVERCDILRDVKQHVFSGYKAGRRFSDSILFSPPREKVTADETFFSTFSTIRASPRTVFRSSWLHREVFFFALSRLC